MKKYIKPECGEIRVWEKNILFLSFPEEPDQTPEVFETSKVTITKDDLLPELGGSLFDD